ncbi:MAG: hypothetical protein JXA33_03860 [Anaerolineae bacterium]|nr:hypothetical protein [Anaerolineae bacterium]
MSEDLRIQNPESRIQRHKYFWLFFIALGVRLITAYAIPEAGYMDTAYYTAGGIRIAEGKGGMEPFIWNYLGEPEGLPVSAFGYWMPLPALITAPFWALGRSFFAAQIPFAVLSSLVVVLGSHIAWEATSKVRAFWGAGGLLIFSSYFFPVWTLPETFAPFALCGASMLWAAGHYWDTRKVSWIVIAAVGATFAYLARSDGLLLIALVCIIPLLRRDIKGLLATGLSIAVMLAPWVVYNFNVRGVPLPTGGTITLWLTNYDDIFCYHCALSPNTYLAWGWTNILDSKLDALVWNLKTLFAVIGGIILFPFTLVGAWRLRRQTNFTLAWLYLALLFAAMTFAFTYPGPRGGFFHSGGAVLPFVVAAALEGLDRVIIWVGKQRRWNLPQAQLVFTIGLVLISLFMSIALTVPKLQKWQVENKAYHEVGQWLTMEDPDGCAILVGDAPRFWLLTRISSLSVPNEDAYTVTEVARRYSACWLYLDKNHPQPLSSFYQHIPEQDWKLVRSWSHGKLYRLLAAQ